MSVEPEYCEHLVESGQAPEMVIPLGPKRSIALCHICAEVVRAHILREIVHEAVKQLFAEKAGLHKL
jgi:hypothetical protein